MVMNTLDIGVTHTRAGQQLILIAQRQKPRQKLNHNCYIIHTCVRELHDHNRTLSSSRVRKKAEVKEGVEKFYTMIMLHLKVEPCTVKLQNNSNC